jgi:predicted nuclease of predicted toxin-antitoxin system
LKILLDECVPWPVHTFLPGHGCKTAQQMGWAALENGDLISAAAAAKFDLFITCDQNIRYQQNLKSREIAILELSTNNFRKIERVAAVLQETVERIGPADFLQLQIP